MSNSVDVDLSKTYHRRELKLPSIQFSSIEGREIFQLALNEGNMDSYFSLAEVFQTQGAPAFCGLGSLSMVLNALLIDPGKVWQGVWRWYEDRMLDCCEDIEVVKEKGIIMSKLACLARCEGAACDEHYAEPSLDEDSFRNLVRVACTAKPVESRKKLMIVSYSRKILNQTGSGHFSPIGGYCASRDLVLIMDVARFKHPPHWVPLTVLLTAMQQVDPDSGRVRGVMMLSSSEALERSCDERCFDCLNFDRAKEQEQKVQAVIKTLVSTDLNAL